MSNVMERFGQHMRAAGHSSSEDSTCRIGGSSGTLEKSSWRMEEPICASEESESTWEIGESGSAFRGECPEEDIYNCVTVLVMKDYKK